MKQPIRDRLADFMLRFAACFFGPRLKSEDEKDLPKELCRTVRKYGYWRVLQQKVRTPRKLARFGQRLMWLYGLHPHFFAKNTLLDNARYLTLHALILP